MKKLKITLFLVFSLIVMHALTLTCTYSQPPPLFYVLLNISITFKENGLATVEMRQHPIAPDGGDLWEFKDYYVATGNINVNDLIWESCCLFSLEPIENVTYFLKQSLKTDDSAVTYYDKDFDGVFDPYKGAWITVIDVVLPRSPDVTEIGGNLSEAIYRVTVNDFYTKSNPSSWIDVINISWEPEVKFFNFSVSPPAAGQPTRKGDRYILWMNSNALSAPDSYVLILGIPGFKGYCESLREVKGEILGVSLVTGFAQPGKWVKVQIENKGEIPADFIVALDPAEGLTQSQARVVYLNPNELFEFSFPISPGSMGRRGDREIHIKLICFNMVLDEETVIVEGQQ